MVEGQQNSCQGNEENRLDELERVEQEVQKEQSFCQVGSRVQSSCGENLAYSLGEE